MSFNVLLLNYLYNIFVSFNVNKIIYIICTYMSATCSTGGTPPLIQGPQQLQLNERLFSILFYLNKHKNKKLLKTKNTEKHCFQQN